MSAQNTLKATQLLVETMHADDKPWFLFELSKALATARCWDEAETVASSMNDLAAESAQEQTLALIEVAKSLITFDFPKHAERLLLKAESFASQIDPDWSWQQAECLNHMANLWHKINNPSKAWMVRALAADEAKRGQEHASPQQSVDASSVLKEIVGDMARSGHVSDAKKLAQQIKIPVKREAALAAIKLVEQMPLSANP